MGAYKSVGFSVRLTAPDCHFGCLVARPLEKVQTKSDVTLVIIPVFLNCKLLLYCADNFLLSIDHE